ncbi:putative membrane protein [Burkholderia pseudomallei]|nr:putative membrane protein [Burkholderia pseudomallei]
MMRSDVDHVHRILIRYAVRLSGRTVFFLRARRRTRRTPRAAHAARRVAMRASTVRFASSSSLRHAAISSRVRRQPSHQPVLASIRQTFVHGDGTPPLGVAFSVPEFDLAAFAFVPASAHAPAGACVAASGVGAVSGAQAASVAPRVSVTWLMRRRAARRRRPARP